MTDPRFDGPRAFTRVEIVCPDDRHYPYLQDALEIRVFGGVARRPDALDTLASLQTRFRNQPGVRTVNIRRHHGCGFQTQGDETQQSMTDLIAQVTGRRPESLETFTDPADDVRKDMEVLRQYHWLPGTVFSGYVVDLDSLESVLVERFEVPTV